MNNKLIVVCVAATITLSMATGLARASTFFQQAPQGDSAIAQTIDRHAKDQRTLDLAAAPIKSLEDFDVYIRGIGIENTPLKKLTLESRHRFIESLRFSKSGLASFDYTDLEHELTATEAYKLLSLFGLQSTTSSLEGLRIKDQVDRLIVNPNVATFIDYKSYECIKPGTCEVAGGRICTSNC